MISLAKFGNTEGVIVAEFGTGDVWMLGSEKGDKGETVLAFKTIDPPREIGVRVATDLKSFDEMKPQLAFVFNKVESIKPKQPLHPEKEAWTDHTRNFYSLLHGEHRDPVHGGKQRLCR
jgi:hypothetical protein